MRLGFSLSVLAVYLRRPRRPAAVLSVAATVVVLSVVADGRGEVTLRFEGQWPDTRPGAAFRWGVRQGGIELAAGGKNVAELSEGSDSPKFTFDVTVPGEVKPGEPPARAWLCFNHDEWTSYVPSFGDDYQVATVVQTAGGLTAHFPPGKWARRKAEPANVLTVHYHRFEGDYDNASLWTWEEHLGRTPERNEILPVGADDFGLVFQLDTSLYGKPGDRIGLLPRREADWNLKDGPDRFWKPALGGTVYIVQGRPEVFADRPDVSPKVAAAALDGENLVTVRFTHGLSAAELSAGDFNLYTPEGKNLKIAGARPVNVRDGRTHAFELTTVEPVDFVRQSHLAGVRGMGTAPVRLRRVLQDTDAFYAPKAELGASYTKQATTFRVFAPTARHAWVVVADTPDGDAGRSDTRMARRDKGIWEATVRGDLAGKFYAYRLDGIGLDRDAEVIDIHATCTQNRAPRSLIVNLDATDPPGFDEQTYTFNGTPSDAIIYEMHIRDFSIAGNSGIEHKGKYLGLTETGTRLPGDDSVTTGLDHLVELGVTHVQLLPVQDFDNDETRDDAYTWGYMPVHFNSPDGWYATSVTGPARITEFKQAVQALHERGIGVVMDVVYNHTAGHASFEKLVPGHYFRMNADGSFSNGSGCGNEFKSESPMARKFILDSLEYWVREYKVDGFRFDLMGLIDLETMKQARARLNKIKPGTLVYGEPWTGGPTPLDPITGHPQVKGTGLGAFNDHFRDAIKGDRDGGLPGYVQVGERAWGIRLGLEGAIHDWSQDPAESINYFEAHDNLTAWDKMLQSMPNANDAERRKAMRFASLILLTSQGTAFLHAGQEFCRTKQGNHNSYNAPDSINRIHWADKVVHADVYAYVRGLIALRKAHPALRLATRQQIEARSYFFDAPNERSFVWRIKGDDLPGETAEEILVLLNGSAQPAGFALPAKGWKVHADADRAGLAPIGAVDDGVQLPPHSGMLLMR